MKGKNMKLNYVQHRDDEGVDEIRCLVNDEPFIRAKAAYRYKTSGLSGDEWRISFYWEAFKGGIWTSFDGGYHKLETAAQAIFPGIYTSHKDWHSLSCTSVDFLRKGRPSYRSTYDGKAIPLLAALGHLPWGFITLPEKLMEVAEPKFPGLFSGNLTSDLCFQVGCSDPAVSTYRLLHRYSRSGHKTEAVSYGDRHDARRFCERHLRRGDCGLDDADVNYEVVEGVGPDGHHQQPGDESPSVFGGVVEL